MKPNWRTPLLFLLAIPASTLAQQSSTPSTPSNPPAPSTSSTAAAPTFDSLDTNHDGVLSREEFAAMSRAHSPGSSSSGNYHSSAPAPHDDKDPPSN